MRQALREMLLLLAGLVFLARGRRTQNSLPSAFSSLLLNHSRTDDARSLDRRQDLLSLLLVGRDSRRPRLGALSRSLGLLAPRGRHRRSEANYRHNLRRGRILTLRALRSLRGGLNESEMSESSEDVVTEESSEDVVTEAEDAKDRYRGGSTSEAQISEVGEESIDSEASLPYAIELRDRNSSQYVMAPEWELRNLERHMRGEINAAELGIENLKHALQDPAYLRETLRWLQDPETMAEVKTYMEDPEFQEQAQRSIEEMDELAAAENEEFAAAQAAGEKPEVPETWWWSALRRTGEAVKFVLAPAQSTGHVATADANVFGDEEQWSGFDPADDSWRRARKKIWNINLPTESRKRVLRDLRRLKKEGEELGIFIEDSEVLTDWVVKVIGQPNTLYEGEIYRLRVRFHPDYPRKPPEVVFMRPAPVHEHIYSDGKICLNILYEDWDPEMDIKSLCLSLLSMLSSAKLKRRPPDNNQTVTRSLGQRAKDMTWYYHDEKC